VSNSYPPTSTNTSTSTTSTSNKNTNNTSDTNTTTTNSIGISNTTSRLIFEEVKISRDPKSNHQEALLTSTIESIALGLKIL
jgi:hypothetical protein